MSIKTNRLMLVPVGENHVLYTGDRNDLKIQDDELDAIKFVAYDKVLDTLALEETKQFFNIIKEKVC